MRILMLGGTGSIGAPVVRELVTRGHDVIALARSSAAAHKVAGLGARPLCGDMCTPEKWLQALPAVDAVIHAAADFSSTAAASDRLLLQALLPHLAAQPRKARFLYTGGCWLYGATGDYVATEATALAPLAVHAWALAHLQQLFDARGIEPIIIHPAMVYEPSAVSSAGSRVTPSRVAPSVSWRAKAYAGPSCIAMTSPDSMRLLLSAALQARAISARPLMASPWAALLRPFADDLRRACANR